jgi:hypothetical protein
LKYFIQTKDFLNGFNFKLGTELTSPFHFLNLRKESGVVKSGMTKIQKI